MKILITGGAGFIGSHIVDRYVQAGNDVVVVDDLSSGSGKNLNIKARFYKLNIQDPKLEEIFNREKPDYVNHHAAQVDVRCSVSDPIFDAGINVMGTINVFQNCIKHSVRKVVFASSGGAIYGEQEVFPAPENHPRRPISPYGITKLIAEHYLHYYKTVHGLDYSVLRYANVYGPRQDPFGEAGVVAIFIQKMLNGEQPVINGDGGQTRDFVYVEDVARANILVMAGNMPENIFNVGTGLETTINTIFDRLNQLSSLPEKKSFGPAKQGEQRRSVIDSSKAKKDFLWEPQVALTDGLKKTYEYFKRIKKG